MASSRTYLISFQLALANELAHRANFLFGVARHFITFTSVLFVFSALPAGVGEYSREQTLTYVVMSAFVSSLIMAFASKPMLDEVSNGFLANYLVKPVHYFLA